MTFRACCCVALVVSLAGVAKGATKPAIEGLSARIDSDRVRVSFRVANGLSDEALEKIHSGIPVTFRHRVDLLWRRSFPLPSKLLSRALIETRAEYDPLTKRYSLLRSLGFKGKKKPHPPPERHSRVTGTTEEVRAWMTEFSDLVLDVPDTSPDPRLKVTVDSALGRRYILLIFPGRLSASAEFRLGP